MPTPAAGEMMFFVDSADDLLKQKDENGIVTTVGGSGGGTGSVELAYAEVVTSLPVVSNDEATADTLVAAPAIIADGVAAVMVDVFVPYVAPSVDFILIINLFEDGADIGRLTNIDPQNAAINQRAAPGMMSRRLVPASGSRTYSARAWVSGTGTATLTVGAGGAGIVMPAFIRVSSV